MTFEKYWNAYRATWATPADEEPLQLPTTLAPMLAAGYHACLSPEQLLKFHVMHQRVRQVIDPLKPEFRTITPAKVEEIMAAYESGAVYPKEVIRKVFAREQVHERYQDDIFGPAST
jgi:hypothetical protein